MDKGLRYNEGVENLYTTDCIRTASGIYVNVFEPTPEMINIEDIAHSLSHQCRFGGHLPRFYSVAQHSAYVAYLSPLEHKLAALMHDASEAYLLDMPKPIKSRLHEYCGIEDRLMKVIAEKFGFEYPIHDDIKAADKKMLEYEWENLMLENDIDFFIADMQPKAAKDYFLNLFRFYSSQPK